MSRDAIENRTSRIWLRDDGVVWVHILPAVKQTLEDARQNLSCAEACAGGVRRPVLIDLREGEPLDPPVRHFYSGTKIGLAFTKLALLVSASPFGRIMGNIYLGIAKPGIPIRLFEEPDPAVIWLLEIL